MPTGKLILVPSPIGNLGDISERMRSALAEADFIAAEDTRVTLRLLSHLDIHKPIVSYHAHNFRSSGENILRKLLNGAVCALITDAGTPAISDPGEDLVRLCAENDIPVTSIPGPCALITALTLSGLPTASFCFEGFLPADKGSKKKRINALRQESRTMIFYEAPHRLVDTLTFLRDFFGAERKISLCRELTKLHEEVIRTTLGDAVTRYEAISPRGEYVLVIAGALETKQETVSIAEAVKMVHAAVAEGVSQKDAVKQISKETGIAKNVLYQAALENTETSLAKRRS